MGKVVPLFGKPSDGSEKPEESPPQASPQSNDEELAGRLLVDYQYFRDNKQLVITANLNAEEMTNFLFDVMKLVRNDNNIELRRGAMKVMTLEQLTSYLTSSGKVQWKAQPHMYGAAYIEFFDRMVTVAMIMDELDKRKEETENHD